MDDHRWALLAWERAARADTAYIGCSLIHVDFHYDGCNDFQSDAEIESLRKMTELSELARLVNDAKVIRKDSFIAPAVIRGLLKNLHFYCLQDDTEPGIDQELAARFGCEQFLYESVGALEKAEVSPPHVFDLCLDLFNKSEQWGEGDLWEEEEISEFLQKVSHFIQCAAVVTVSLSFGYSGSANETRRLARLVLPRMLRYRGIVGSPPRLASGAPPKKRSDRL
jgi:hypothetical protein